MPDSVPDARSLYRRIVGEAFDTLPPVLRRFHDRPDGAEARGTLRVTRGKGKLRRLAADLMRLPAAGDRVAMRLEVRAEGDGECWIRHFDRLKIETQHRLQNGLLIETAGPLRFDFRVTADPNGMRFTQAGCRLFFVPLPSALSPQVTASATGQDTAWLVSVQVAVPLLGLLVRYEGEVMPLC